LEIAAQKLVKSYGSASLLPIEVATAIVISGKPMKRSFLKKLIVALVKKVDKQIMLNVGTACCDKG
jgi:hypothetical protein